MYYWSKLATIVILIEVILYIWTSNLPFTGTLLLGRESSNWPWYTSSNGLLPSCFHLIKAPVLEILHTNTKYKGWIMQMVSNQMKKIIKLDPLSKVLSEGPCLKNASYLSTFSPFWIGRTPVCKLLQNLVQHPVTAIENTQLNTRHM